MIIWWNALVNYAQNDKIKKNVKNLHIDNKMETDFCVYSRDLLKWHWEFIWYEDVLHRIFWIEADMVKKLAIQ